MSRLTSIILLFYTGISGSQLELRAVFQDVAAMTTTHMRHETLVRKHGLEQEYYIEEVQYTHGINISQRNGYL